MTAYVLILWTGIVTAMALVDAPVALRIVFAAPIMLLVPGWLTLRIVAIGWTRFEIFVGSVVVSLSEIILLGFFLYYIGGLGPLGWTISLAALMGTLLLIKPLRTGRLVAFLALLPRLPNRVFAYFACAILLSGLALAIAIKDARMDRPYEILQLWIVPMPADSVTIGITNGEDADRDFRLDVRGEGRIIEALENLEVNGNSTYTVSIKTGLDVAKQERVQAVLSDRTGRVLRRVSTTIQIPSN